MLISASCYLYFSIFVCSNTGVILINYMRNKKYISSRDELKNHLNKILTRAHLAHITSACARVESLQQGGDERPHSTAEEVIHPISVILFINRENVHHGN